MPQQETLQELRPVDNVHAHGEPVDQSIIEVMDGEAAMLPDVVTS